MIAKKVEKTWRRAPILVVLMAAALASGCAATRYVKAGATEEQVKRDRAECLETGFGAPSLQPYPSVDRDVVDRCMAGRGYAIRE
jgi:hypothetical protein